MFVCHHSVVQICMKCVFGHHVIVPRTFSPTAMALVTAVLRGLLACAVRCPRERQKWTQFRTERR